MATNEILPFATDDTGTNLLTQAEYSTDEQREIGHQPGIARSKLANKAMRQASLLAAGVAEFIADNQNNDVEDALTPQQIADYLLSALQETHPARPTLTFITSGAGTYTPPAGVKKLLVDVIGGGGGAGGVDGQGGGTRHSSGGGSGGGFCSVIIDNVEASYTYEIGAGGVGGSGVGGSGENRGLGGGTSRFVGNSVNLAAYGGKGGAGVTAIGGNAMNRGRDGGTSEIISGTGIEGTGLPAGGFGIVGGIISSVSCSGCCPLIGGGRNPQANNTNGYDATVAGEGGGACIVVDTTSNRSGGDGFRGLIRITEIY